jgi:SAM-dependent methyltransferase
MAEIQMLDDSFYKTFNKLFASNIRFRGLKAAIFSLGLGASRYIEYSVVMDLSRSSTQDRLLIELGCGHSILPSIWNEIGLQVIAIDINEDALKWQRATAKTKQRNKENSVQVIRASAESLPLREKSIFLISVISVIEHLQHDTETVNEIGRILGPHGLYIISAPLSGSNGTVVKSGYWTGIPSIYKRFLGSGLLSVLKLFRVDRGAGHFERLYGSCDVRKRLVKPSDCKLEGFVTLRSKPLVRIIHSRIVPTGVLSILDLILARFFMVVGESMTNMDAIILAARKTPRK